MLDDLDGELIAMSELELLVASAIEAADPQLPGGLDDDLDSDPSDWLPEARAAVITIVQVLRDTGAHGGGRYAAGWMEAANWLEDQLLEAAAAFEGPSVDDDNEDEDDEDDDAEA